MDKKEIEQSEAAHAFNLFESLVAAKREIGAKFLLVGSLLTEIKEKKLYKYFNCDTFQGFLAIPEIGFAWQTSRLFMHVFDLYIRKLKCDTERIANIQIGNLQVINPVVKEDPDEWLSLAENLSRSDLINAVREHQGKSPMKMLPAGEEDGTHIIDIDNYLDFVRQHRCIVCGASPSDPHHFPRTKGAGAAEHKAIPLCRKCHSKYQEHADELIKDYLFQICDYFYDIIQQAYKIITKG